MAKSRKVKMAAGAAAAVAVAGGGAALAASQPWSPKTESQAVIEDAAKQLGIDPGKLSDALKQALKDRVDAAVEAGRLTKAEGDALKARIDAGGAPLVFGAFGPGGFGHVAHFGKLEAAASYLGLSEDELESRLDGGKTLARIAKDEGKSVDGLVQAMVKDAEQKIDRAVADGRLTKSEADRLKQDLERRVADIVDGTRPSLYGFRGRHMQARPGAGGGELGPGWRGDRFGPPWGGKGLGPIGGPMGEPGPQA